MELAHTKLTASGELPRRVLRSCRSTPALVVWEVSCCKNAVAHMVTSWLGLNRTGEINVMRACDSVAGAVSRQDSLKRSPPEASNTRLSIYCRNLRRVCSSWLKRRSPCGAESSLLILEATTLRLAVLFSSLARDVPPFRFYLHGGSDVGERLNRGTVF